MLSDLIFRKGKNRSNGKGIYRRPWMTKAKRLGECASESPLASPVNSEAPWKRNGPEVMNTDGEEQL